ncbi:MAG: hypothetical protein ABUT20_49760, partial [Bacteroidota bacterium]
MPKKINNDTRLLSAEVKEIIFNNPPWMVRNGISLFVLLLGCLLAASFFISYPDIIKGNAKLICINPSANDTIEYS